MTAQQCNGITPDSTHDCGACCTSHCSPGCASRTNPGPLPLPTATEVAGNSFLAALMSPQGLA